MNKKTLIKIRELSAKIPVTYVKGMKEQLQVIQDLRGKELKNSQFFEVGQIHVETAPEIIKVKNETLYKVNHYRRMKKAYQLGGVPAMQKYIRWVGENNRKLNTEYETKLVTDLVSFINKKTIQPFL